MRILLTGASGFIGRALLQELLETEHELTLISRKPLGSGIHELVATPENWNQAVKGLRFDLCIHMAWIATPGTYLTSPENPLLATASANLAQELFAGGLSHFLGLGTCIEYAPHQNAPCSESQTPTEPVSPYALAKDQARQLIAAAAARCGASYTWARIFHPYGPGEDPRRIPSTFLTTLLNRQPLNLMTPDSTKDWIEISDVVSAIKHLALECPPQGVINIGTGIGTRIKSLAENVARITGADPGLIRCQPTGKNDPYHFHVADISKLLATGWKPSTALATGLARLLDHIQTR